jgi:methionyl-tRNA formyltransferase
MKIIFAGTPGFSVSTLEALIDAGHEIVGVYCQPDRPKGRGRILTACPVKEKALELDLTVYQPENLRDSSAQKTLKNLGADVMIVVAYGQILPLEVLESPKYGCLNIHASLLPRWRGAAPIQRAILAGDKQTGVGIMQMNEGLDTGDVLLEKICNISDTDTAQTLHNKLATLGADAIVEALENINNLVSKTQDKSGITYAKKLSKEEAWIDWTQSAIQISQQIRAFNPYPIAQCNASSDKFDAKTLRILSASIIGLAYNQKPGEIIEYGKGVCIIATGDGALNLEQVQLADKKVVNIKDFTNAYKITKLE